MKGTPAQIAAYVGKSERTIHRWLSSGKMPYKRLPGGLIEVDDKLLFEPESGNISTIMEALTRIEEKLDILAARDTTPSRTVRHESAPAQPIQGELPEGLVAWRDYAKEKGYPETTVKRAIDRGDIPVITGRWKRGKVYIEAAIDEQGKAAMDGLYGSK